MKARNNADTVEDIDQALGGVSSTAVRNEIAAYRQAVDALPEAVRSTEAAKRALEYAQQRGPLDAVDYLRKALKKGNPGEVPPDTTKAAAEDLEQAEFYESTVRRLMRSSLLNVADFYRADKRLVGKLEKLWASEVHPDIHKETESYATVTSAARIADQVAAALFDAACILDQPENKYQRSLLRDSFDRRPPSMPRLKPLLQAAADAKAGKLAKADAAQARSLAMRAAADGRAVSTGRVDVDDADREAIRTTARRNSGRKVEEVGAK